MSTSEIWAQIQEYPNYAVSDQGRVMRLTNRTSGKAGYVLQAFIGKAGYPEVKLNDGAGQVTLYAHALVAKYHVIHPSETQTEVNHIDGDKTNNHATNLEWVTPKENGAHASLIGLIQKGSERPNAKLTETDIPAVYVLRSSGYSQREIGDLYGVSQPIISRVLSRQLWRHVEAA